MPKKIATAEQITAEIQRRIREGNELSGDCRGCRAPHPTRCDPADYPGANWIVDVIDGTIRACIPVLQDIVLAVRAEYDLPPDED